MTSRGIPMRPSLAPKRRRSRTTESDTDAIEGQMGSSIDRRLNIQRLGAAALCFAAAMAIMYSGHDNGRIARNLRAEGGEPDAATDSAVDAAVANAKVLHPTATVKDPNCPLSDLDLLLPMHHKDFPLASTLFNSLEKALPCFNDLIVLVPPESEFALVGGVPSYAKVVVVPDPLPSRFGYLSQQVVKIYADVFTTAPRVLILEADLIIKEWRDSCFFGVDSDGAYNGKVRAYCNPEGADVWFKGTGHALGGPPVDMDCCVNSPFAFPREVFPAFREHIQKVHKKPFGEFMEDYFDGHSKGWTKQSTLFSEFNMLSHFMIRHRPDLVELVTPDDPLKFHEERTKCSDHLNTRNYALPNPKLTSEYFETYYHILDATAKKGGNERKLGDRTRTSLDIGKTWPAEQKPKQKPEDPEVTKAKEHMASNTHVPGR